MRRLALVLLLVVCCACGSVVRPGGQPAGTASPSLSEWDLRFRLIDTVGHPFFCDPTQYPIARPQDPAEAARQVADLRSQHADEFDAIVRHEHLDAANLSPQADLRILSQARVLAAVPLTADGSRYRFSYQVDRPQEDVVAGTIDRTGAIVVESRTPGARRMCPICLALWTRIAAPGGALPVADVRPGDVVWTLDAAGGRVAAPVLAVGHAPAPPGHVVVHLQLADGRAVDASPGHPLPDGRAVGDLAPGDRLDGSVVVAAQRRPYAGGATWDLLPAGPTHVYWADGVPLSSTLAVVGSIV